MRLYPRTPRVAESENLQAIGDRWSLSRPLPQRHGLGYVYSVVVVLAVVEVVVVVLWLVNRHASASSPRSWPGSIRESPIRRFK